MARIRGRGRSRGRRSAPRDFEWVRVQGFFTSSSVGVAPRGVDLLSIYRSSPNANYQNATVTRVRGWLFPDFTDVTASQIVNAGLQINNWDFDPALIANIPINGPDEDWMAWFPVFVDGTSVPPVYANWNEGGGWAVDVKAQRTIKQRQQTLWLMGDPGSSPVTWNYNLSIGLKLA